MQSLIAGKMIAIDNVIPSLSGAVTPFGGGQFRPRTESDRRKARI
jgi:hypothetical protein